MSISVTCPKCKGTMTAKDELLGSKARCPYCMEIVAVEPSASEPRASAADEPPRRDTKWQEQIGERPGLGSRPAPAKERKERKERSRRPSKNIDLRCPACGRANWFREEQSGGMEDCRQCDTPMYVPYPEEMRNYRASNRPLIIGLIAACSIIVIGLVAVGAYFAFSPRAAVADAAKGNAVVAKAEDRFAAAPTLALQANLATVHDSRIDQPRAETMVKLKAPASGIFAVQFDSDGGKLDGRLFAYNGARMEIAQNDADAERRVGQLFFAVEANQEYFVKAACADEQTGPFKLTLTALTDVGNDFDHALDIKLSRRGEATFTSKIEPEGDVDYFRFTAPFEGQMALELRLANGSQLDSSLWAYNADRGSLGNSTVPDINAPRTLRLFVQTGQMYYVKVDAFSGANFDRRTGAYTLSFHLDRTGPGAPNPKAAAVNFDTAREVFLDNKDWTRVSGSIMQPNDVQIFRIKAKTTGNMIVDIEYPQFSNLDAYMIAYDANKKEIGYNELTFTLPTVAGNTYYIKVGAKQFPGIGLLRTGAFDLNISPNNGNPGVFNNQPNAEQFAAAQVVSMKDGAGSVKGQMNNNFDARFFKIKADKDGLLVIQSKSDALANLIVRSQLYDSLKLPLGKDFVGIKEVVVTAGNVYYVRVLAQAPLFGAQAFGSFQLSVSTEKIQPDDFGNDYAVAHALALPDMGNKNISGRIEVPGDADFFKFTAPETGWMHVVCAPSLFSILDQDLHCFDDARREVGHPYFPVEKGRTYYAKVSAWATPLDNRRITGGYALTVRFEKNLADDYGNDFATASLVDLLAGLTFRNGRIETDDDVDFFRFQATTNGPMVIKLMPQFNGRLNGHLFVYDQDKNLVKDTDQGIVEFGLLQPLFRQANINVKNGQLYYVKVAASKRALKDESRGVYTLELDNQPPNQGLGGFKNPGKLPAPGKLVLSKFGSLAANDPMDKSKFGCFAKVFAFKMTQGKLYTIDMSSKQIDSYLRLEDANGQELARDDDGGGFPNARISFIPVETGTYNIIATSFGANELGAFTLRVHEK